MEKTYTLRIEDLSNGSKWSEHYFAEPAAWERFRGVCFAVECIADHPYRITLKYGYSIKAVQEVRPNA